MGTQSHGDLQGPSRISRRTAKTERKRGCHDRCSEFKGPNPKPEDRRVLRRPGRGPRPALGAGREAPGFQVAPEPAVWRTTPNCLGTQRPQIAFCIRNQPFLRFTAKHCLKSPHSFMSLHIPKSRISPMLRLFLVDSPVAVLLNRPK